MKKIILLALCPLLLISCGSEANSGSTQKPITSSTSSTDSTSSVEDNELSVIVLAGQSNMEGNSWSQYISTAYGFSQDEVNRINNGFEGISINYRCFWNGNPDGGTSSNGAFVPVRLGQANTTSKFGPEIGIADYLSSKGYSGKIALIKYAVGASALAPQAGEWGSPSMGISPNGKWYDNTLTLVNNGLNALKTATGKNPVIKALCWMQGEADSTNATYRENYFNNLSNFVKDLREEWKEESKEGGFTFIDAGISQYWTNHVAINNAKYEFFKLSDNNKLIDTISEGLEYSTQPVGNVDYYHYDASSMFKLGQLFGKQIISAL